MPRAEGPLARLVEALTSLKLTLVCLTLLMILVVACTLAQVPLGTHAAVETYIRSFLVWWKPEGLPFKLPIFPGGGLIGLVLLANLLFAQFLRLERSWRKAGLWVIHFGLALLFVGEFAAALLQVESRIPIEEGHTRDWSEDYRQMELAVIDVTEKDHDDVRAFPHSLLLRGGTLEHDSLPFKVNVRAFHENAALTMRRPGDPASPATAGIGTNIAVRGLPPVASDDDENTAAALVEPVAGGKPLGTWLVSNALPAPQTFVHDGRTWRLALRNRRYYLPFTLTLKDFRHDVYPGTDIPKNFSSLVRLKDPARAEDRDVLISMNSPLRHGGRTFYQASFGKNDTLSVLQVVRNPGWTVPYAACLLAGLGLLWHFAAILRKTLGKPA